MSEDDHIIYEPSESTHWKMLFPQKSALLGSHNLPGEPLKAQGNAFLPLALALALARTGLACPIRRGRGLGLWNADN